MAGVLQPVDDVVRALLSRAVTVSDVEPVGLAEAHGRTLAAAVVARVNVPPLDNSSMDGYAVDASDPLIVSGATVPVSDRIPAGQVGKPLAPGTAARIFTGAPIPEGANAIVIQEDTVAGDGEVTLNVTPEVSENVRPAGQDIAAGAVVLEAGTRLRPQELALAASAGHASLSCYRRLRVGVMSTGDELVPPGSQPGPGQIFNSNHYALIGLLQALGMVPVDLGLVADTRVATEAALLRGASEVDCILSSGGVSVGEEDHVKDALEALGRLDIWRIAIKPGKPLAFGEIDGTPFFGLPGNPVSTFVTFLMIARPFLLAMQGDRDVQPRSLTAKAQFDTPTLKRREYFRVRLELDEAGDPVVLPFPNQGSGIMSSLSWANALAEVDMGSALSIGDPVKVYLL